jgi:hypothetical protein
MNTNKHGSKAERPVGSRMDRNEVAWAAESERRIDAYNKGQLTARAAKDVFADLKKKLRK